MSYAGIPGPSLQGHPEEPAPDSPKLTLHVQERFLINIDATEVLAAGIDPTDEDAVYEWAWTTLDAEEQGTHYVRTSFTYDITEV